MAKQYQTPGVYVEEIAKFPPSVAGVATAIPAFIGYTEIAGDNDQNRGVPVRITSLLEYEALFGKGPTLSVNENKSIENIEFVLYDSIRLFYDNGGGVCYIVSIGQYDIDKPDNEVKVFKDGIDALEKVDEVTLVLFPDAVGLANDSDLAAVQNHALKHCQKIGDRFAILDVKKKGGSLRDDIQAFRDEISGNDYELRYGAAYYPYLSTIYTKTWSIWDVRNFLGEFPSIDEETDKKVARILTIDPVEFLSPEDDSEIEGIQLTEEEAEEEELLDEKKAKMKEKLQAENNLRIKSIIPLIPGYADAVKKLNAKATTIPPSGAIAGIYSATDQYQGVWKAPANVSIASLSGVSDFITNQDQKTMNVSETGKSINAIRAFSGKGILVWGARTLDGNSNEWRYVPVRRLFNYIEESVQKSTSWAVFSPNDGNTWIKIKSQIENFLNNLWRAGALAGSTPEKAYFVNVGLGITMTKEDINEGYLYVDIGLAAVRPAEFIVLRFSHKVQE